MAKSVQHSRKSKAPRKRPMRRTETGPTQTAFVIMPILDRETPDHDHFRSILENYIRTAAEGYYKVIRSDEITRSGSFVRDVVSLLAKSDLVIADITDSNPNVLYELGVRHALRKSGTILLRDKNRTPEAPADLQPYRSILYTTDATGLPELKAELEEALSDYSATRSSDLRSDNPVYDYLEEDFAARPNGVAFRSEGRRSTTGEGLDEGTTELSPLERLRIAREEAEEGLHPPRLIEAAGNAVREGDTVAFLDALEQFVSVEMLKPTEREYLDMYYLARRLDARAATDAIWELASAAYPESQGLREVRISYLAHSKVQSDWELAISMAERLFEMDLRSTDVDVEKLTTEKSKGLLGVLLDAFDKLDEHTASLRITDSLVGKYPASTHSWRNFARALEGDNQGGLHDEKILDAYINSINCEDVDDTSANWFGNTLSRLNRDVEAIELRVLSCLLDLDEASNYTNFAAQLAKLIQPTNQIRSSRAAKILPERFDEMLVSRALVLARDCESFGAEERYSSEAVMDTVGIDSSDLEQAEEEIGDVSRKYRSHMMSELFNEIRSELTEMAGSGELKSFEN